MNFCHYLWIVWPSNFLLLLVLLPFFILFTESWLYHQPYSTFGYSVVIPSFHNYFLLVQYFNKNITSTPSHAHRCPHMFTAVHHYPRYERRCCTSGLVPLTFRRPAPRHTRPAVLIFTPSIIDPACLASRCSRKFFTPGHSSIPKFRFSETFLLSASSSSQASFPSFLPSVRPRQAIICHFPASRLPAAAASRPLSARNGAERSRCASRRGRNRGPVELIPHKRH